MLARYSPFVLKAPLNTKQPNKLRGKGWRRDSVLIAVLLRLTVSKTDHKWH